MNKDYRTTSGNLKIVLSLTLDAHREGFQTPSKRSEKTEAGMSAITVMGAVTAPRGTRRWKARLAPNVAAELLDAIGHTCPTGKATHRTGGVNPRIPIIRTIRIGLITPRID